MAYSLRGFVLLPKTVRVQQYGFKPKSRSRSIPGQPLVEGFVPRSHGIHTKAPQLRKAKIEPSPEPYKFTASPANVRSLPKLPNHNEYQGLIVGVSVIVFVTYFCYLREENDLDEQLNVSLFDRVPKIEEPHLAQAIPRMKARGEDTTEAEARLKELIEKRLAQEKNEIAKK